MYSLLGQTLWLIVGISCDRHEFNSHCYLCHQKSPTLNTGISKPSESGVLDVIGEMCRCFFGSGLSYRWRLIIRYDVVCALVRQTNVCWRLHSMLLKWNSMIRPSTYMNRFMLLCSSGFQAVVCRPEGVCRWYGGGLWQYPEHIHQHCIVLASTAYDVLKYTHSTPLEALAEHFDK